MIKKSVAQVGFITFFFTLMLMGCANTPTNSIKSLDFKNMTYENLECDELPKSVNVKHGSFTTRNSNIEINFSVQKIIFGDLDADGDDEAVVLGLCSMRGGNFTLSQVFIYSIKYDVALNLWGLTDKELEQTYRQHYPDGNLWQLAGIKIMDNELILDRYAEGAHCCPEYLVSFKYKIKQNQLILADKPVRNPMKSKS